MSDVVLGSSPEIPNSCWLIVILVKGDSYPPLRSAIHPLLALGRGWGCCTRVVYRNLNRAQGLHRDESAPMSPDVEGWD